MKPFKTTPDGRVVNGFTLLELVVVIAVIAILMSLLFAAAGSARESTRRSKAKIDLLQIVSALHAFHTDYEAYPLDREMRRIEVTFATRNSDLINALRAVPEGANAQHALNPRQTVYIEVPPATDQRHPRSGIFNGSWYDPWGPDPAKPESGVYHIRIAAPDRHQVTNPYPGGDGGEAGEKNEGDEKSEPMVDTDVIAWSLGKGGIQTYELRDQIISWR
jgi:prepilin-type N-terminal cleavage/methylation domain-containing protein